MWNSFCRSQKLFQVFILGAEQFVGRTFEVNFAVAEDQHVGGARVILLTGADRGFLALLEGLRAGGGIAVGGERHDEIGGLIEAEIGEAESILHAMGGEQRGDILQIAAAQDQRDDGLRSDGIETGGGRIVHDDGRTIHESARDGNAAAHTAGKFAGKFLDGLFHFDEAQRLAHLGFDFGFGHVFLAHAEGNIVEDVEGIEQRAFLKDETDAAAEIEELFFGHLAYILTHHQDLAGIGTNQAGGEFHDEGFAGAGFAEEDFGFAVRDVKRNATENISCFETQVDIAE